MLFKQIHLEGIKAGTISLAFRKWARSSVHQGSLIKTSVGIVRVISVQEVSVMDITEKDASEAGFPDLRSLIKMLDTKAEGHVFRIEVEYYSPDPRIALREETDIHDIEFEIIKTALTRLDKYSKYGEWTKEVLIAIRDNPRLKAGDLAVLVRKDKEWLKLHVRKLKELGLTISFEPGYMISPRGEEVMRKFYS